jgi:hypothetical protein
LQHTDIQEDSSIDEQEERKPVITSRTLYSDRLQIFTTVIAAYNSMKDLPPVVAMCWDDHAESHSRRWSTTSAEYQADFESTARRWIMKQPDKASLRLALNELIDGKEPKTASERRIVTSLAPLFKANLLLPVDYFRKVKVKSPWI